MPFFFLSILFQILGAGCIEINSWAYCWHLTPFKWWVLEAFIHRCLYCQIKGFYFQYDKSHCQKGSATLINKSKMRMKSNFQLEFLDIYYCQQKRYTCKNVIVTRTSKGFWSINTETMMWLSGRRCWTLHFDPWLYGGMGSNQKYHHCFFSHVIIGGAAPI